MDFVDRLVFVTFLLSPFDPALSFLDDAHKEPNYKHTNWWTKRETIDSWKENQDIGDTTKDLLSEVRSAYTDYNYSECEGPLTWAHEFPACDGYRQSPININLPTAVHLNNEYNIIFKNYNMLPDRMSMKNTGKTVIVKAAWDDDKRPYIKGGILEGKYVFYEIHFHWGATIFEPSEHLINGYSFPLEMHLVHYKESYGSLSNAKDHNDGLATVAYVFESTNEENHLLQRIIEELPHIQDKTDPPVSLTPFKISKLAPLFNKDFATYLGSLTMPPCSEIVIWIVYLKPLNVRCNQVDQFRKIKDREGNYIERNFRPLQKLNGRKVFLVSKYYFY